MHHTRALYSTEALCPLSVPHPHPPCAVVPLPRWRCVLFLQWPSRESQDGWRGSWRERGASSLKTMWRCCSPPNGKYLWTSYDLHQEKICGDACASTLHHRAFFIQTPEFSQASDNMLLLVEHCWYTSMCIFRQFCDACARNVSLILLWSSIHMDFSITEWVCTYNILLCTEML